MTDLEIRDFTPDDLAALYDVCLRTGATGGDATGLVENARLFGEIWAAPYALFEPEHTHVIAYAQQPAGTTHRATGGTAGRNGVVGYVLGTIDAAAFEERCEEEWWPELRERYPLQEGGTRLDDLLIALIHHRPEPRRDLADRYPSELHIDMLPVAQGHGWGRRLLERMFTGLADAGSPGVHLGVSVNNTNAVAFYRHIGFEEFDCDGINRIFVMDL